MNFKLFTDLDFKDKSKKFAINLDRASTAKIVDYFLPAYINEEIKQQLQVEVKDKKLTYTETELRRIELERSRKINTCQLIIHDHPETYVYVDIKEAEEAFGLKLE